MLVTKKDELLRTRRIWWQEHKKNTPVFSKTHTKVGSGHLQRTRWRVLSQSVSHEVFVIQTSCLDAASIYHSSIWQERMFKKLPPQRGNIHRCPSRMCPTLVLRWVNIWHHDDIWNWTYWRNRQLLVCCWCREPASSVWNHISEQSQPTAIDSWTILSSVSRWFWLLRWSHWWTANMDS